MVRAGSVGWCVYVLCRELGVVCLSYKAKVEELGTRGVF